MAGTIRRSLADFHRAFRSLSQAKVPSLAEKPMTLKKDRTDRFQESHPSSEGWSYSSRNLLTLDTKVLCCGVKELHGIQSHHALLNSGRAGKPHGAHYERVQPFEIIEFVQEQYDSSMHRRARPFIFFTDNHQDYKPNEPKCGQALLEYIVANKLGRVFRTGKKLNENSGATIEMFTWVVDWPKLLKFKPTDPRVKTAAAAAK